MSLDIDLTAHTTGMQTPHSEEFALYCEAELEKRLNSGEKFDVAVYREAIELVMTKLKALEAEEIA